MPLSLALLLFDFQNELTENLLQELKNGEMVTFHWPVFKLLVRITHAQTSLNKA
jgi:hypothetical protein